MESYLTVWLVVTSVNLAIDLYLTARQLKALSPTAPYNETVAKFVNEEGFRASQAYQYERLFSATVTECVETLISIGMIVFNFYPWTLRFINHHFPEWVSQSSILCSIVFLLVGGLVQAFISLPGELYSDFVVEERHQYNRKTLGLFFTDKLKYLAIMAVLTAILVAPVSFLVNWAGPNCTIYLWVLFAAVSLAMMWVFPLLILPMFYVLQPLRNEELRQRIEKLARRVSYPLTKIHELDASKRSGHSNALLWGFWKSKHIILYDTILKQDPKEIEAVLGHELGHWKHSHTIKQYILQQIFSYILCYLLKVVIFSRESYAAFGFPADEAMPIGVGLVIVSIVIAPASSILGAMIHMISRRYELQADQYAADLGYSKELVSGLLCLQEENKGCWAPDPWYAAWNYSHPTAIERVQILKAKNQ